MTGARHHPPHTLWIAVTITIAAVTVTACDGSMAVGPDGPAMAAVAGVYRTGGEFTALSFTTDDGSMDVDWLEHDASLTLDLAGDGTVSGELYIPVPSDPTFHPYFEEEDIDRGYFGADMAGAWTLEGQTVRFEQEADSFVRDMAFVFTDGTLTGDETFSGVRIRVVLTGS